MHWGFDPECRRTPSGHGVSAVTSPVALRRKLLRGLGGGVFDRHRGGSWRGGGRRRGGFDLPILLENAPLHALAGLSVQWMGDVLELAVLLSLRRHRDEQAVRPLHNF